MPASARSAKICQLLHNRIIFRRNRLWRHTNKKKISGELFCIRRCSPRRWWHAGARSTWSLFRSGVHFDVRGCPLLIGRSTPNKGHFVRRLLGATYICLRTNQCFQKTDKDSIDNEFGLWLGALTTCSQALQARSCSAVASLQGYLAAARQRGKNACYGAENLVWICGTSGWFGVYVSTISGQLLSATSSGTSFDMIEAAAFHAENCVSRLMLWR
jgi:hypothetical protein